MHSVQAASYFYVVGLAYALAGARTVTTVVGGPLLTSSMVLLVGMNLGIPIGSTFVSEQLLLAGTARSNAPMKAAATLTWVTAFMVAVATSLLRTLVRSEGRSLATDPAIPALLVAVP